MSGPWDDYAAQPPAPQSAQPQGPWADYAAAQPKKTSQALGFMEGVANVLEKVPPNPLNYIPGLDGRANDARAKAQMEGYFRREEQTKNPGKIGKVVGGMVATAPVVAITKNPFAVGAAQGALTSEKDTAGGVAGDAAMGAALNWFGGKVMGGVADAISPVTSGAVQRLEQAGVKLTPGMQRGGKAMLREDKKMSRPFVGSAISEARAQTGESFSTASVNEALKPLGVKVPSPVKPGHDTIAFAQDAVSDAYEKVIPNLAVQIDGRKFAQTLMPAASTLPPPQQKLLQQIVSAKLKNGQLSGQALKDAQGELRRLASTYSRDASAENRELGRVLWQADDELTANMMAQNPQWAPQLQKVNAAYRGLKIAEDAASRADNGIANTGQLKQAVRRADRTKNKSATAAGNAFMQQFSNDAREVIPATLPNTGSADRLMQGNIFANAAGAMDLAGFRGQQLLDAARGYSPQTANVIANALRRVKGPGAAAAVAYETDN